MSSVFFFFFQAEDGIRDSSVTGVQTCALPISFSTDGKVLTVVDGTIRRLDLATGKTLSAWQIRHEPPEGFRGGLGGGMSFIEGPLSADGTLLAMLQTHQTAFNNTNQTLPAHPPPTPNAPDP